MHLDKTIAYDALSDPLPQSGTLTKIAAASLFEFFRTCPLFNWKEANNDCEDRAHAACLLLRKWNIPSCKAWVFSGSFLKKDGGLLTNNWKYHVAAAIPVLEDGVLSIFVLDPATLAQPGTIAFWAGQITDQLYSYHFVKESSVYIFNPVEINRENWYTQNRQNYKWTIQGLSGINGVTKTGKAQLVFQKSRIRQTEKAFRHLMQNKPVFLQMPEEKTFDR